MCETPPQANGFPDEKVCTYSTREKKQELIYVWPISSNEVKQKPTFVFINSQFIEDLKDWFRDLFKDNVLVA